MAKATEAASGFSISGLLDADARTRERFHVAEIPVADIADHPANTAYTMDASGIAKLAESIRKDGLTDIPLVRKLDSGSFQMLSGHRRKAAYALLAQSDDSYSSMPCRIIEGVSDAEALVLVHTANFFIRQLNVLERAAASEALGIEVERIREADPLLAGVRTEDIKAAIIAAHTGKPISGKTVQRQEATAHKAKTALIGKWRSEVEAGNLTDAAIHRLAKMSSSKQRDVYAEHKAKGLSKEETSAALKVQTADAGKLLRKAERVLRDAAACEASSFGPSDAVTVTEIERLLATIEEMVPRT